jgi:hypothetical protein
METDDKWRAIVSYLYGVDENWKVRQSDPVLQLLTQLKHVALQGNDEAEAKRIWCYKQVLHIQEKYISAFQKMKEEKYYDGWCDLEQVELNLNRLERHKGVLKADFQLSFIRIHTSRFQELFPYKIFASPEFVIRKRVCSICNQPRGLRSRCGHKVGEIYRGEHCYNIVEDCEFISIALVQNPVQKYSVVFSDRDKSDSPAYHLIRYCVERLRNPFHGWSFIRTTARHPHSLFRGTGRNYKCPCESGLKYKKCCMLNPNGVLKPHIQFNFSVPPASWLEGTVYTGYENRARSRRISRT